MDEACRACCLRQADRVAALLELDETVRRELRRAALDRLEGMEPGMPAPEAMGELWAGMTARLGVLDPYGPVRTAYNREMLRLAGTFRERLRRAEDPFRLGLLMAVTGNLIDFAPGHAFSPETVRRELEAAGERTLAVDDGEALRRACSRARSLLYLGDNGGEIVLDRLFLEVIREQNPSLRVTFGVRGRPVLNDVTEQDARQAGMDRVAAVLSNGDGSPGTVLSRVSPAFSRAFREADVVIAKGQGNYESLCGCGRKELYLLFLAKCEAVARPLGIPPMSPVCLKSR